MKPVPDVVEIVLGKVCLIGITEINANVTTVQVDDAQKHFEIDLLCVS
ncbi:MAG: hypothetical protein LBJ78_00050 [Puniceicoccales bacterium]|nr:hypothetical protein [Puniceicoccales bacterium]